ncbi:DUF4097 family beta strand repeat-containing protein [Virgibacillus kimchii]
MRNVKKMTLLALLLIAVGVIGAIFTFNLSDEMTLAAEREVDGENIERIDIHIDNGSVNIFPADTKQVRLNLEGIVTEGEEPSFSIETNEGTLMIQIKEKRKFFRINPFSGSPELNIYLPDKRYESLTAEMDNGAFQAEDLSINEIQAKTDNGSVVLDRVMAVAADVRTSNGKIELNHVEGDVTGKSNNGAISLTADDLDRDINMETDNGKITVKTEKEPTNAVIDARTDNGRITVFGNTDWDTVIGNGEHEIKLRTNNGRITIDK